MQNVKNEKVHRDGHNSCEHDHEHEHGHDHEADIFSHGHDHSHGEGDSKIVLVKIIISAIVLVSSFIFKNEKISIVCALLAYLIAGYDVLWTAIKNILKGQVFDENFLMALASVGAIVIGEYPEAAGVMVFYQIGEFFQDMAVNKSRKQIKALLNIKPEFANLKTLNGIERVKPEIIKIGDIIVVKPGEKIPLDGVVTEGASSLDTSALTGESMPVDVGMDAEVLSGSINQTGVIIVEVKKLYKDSTVSKILYLVENASSKKAVTENFITKFAKYYTPAVVLCAVFIGIVFPLLTGSPNFYDWFYKGLVFLVVSCPCALILSIPLSYFGGLGCSSKFGILVKGGNYLEALSKAEIAVFDKTGTLTEGKFKVEEIKAFGNFSEKEVIKIAAHVEYYSNHPIAVSIKKGYDGKIDENAVKNYEEVAGLGVVGYYDNKKVAIGNEKLMHREKVKMNSAGEKPGTVLYISIDGEFAGFMVIIDQIKENSYDLIKALKEVGIKKTVMLTGDNKAAAMYVKDKLGLDDVYYSLLPQHKVEKVEELFKEKSKNGKLLFVGDGINDAPVLMRADVGFAMGGVGSDAAIESADVVIMNDEPQKVAQSIKIAKRTKVIVWQNIIFALGVKFGVMILTVFTNVTMPIAIFADVGVALIAVLNATRALNMKK